MPFDSREGAVGFLELFDLNRMIHGRYSCASEPASLSLNSEIHVGCCKGRKEPASTWDFVRDSEGSLDDPNHVAADNYFIRVTATSVSR